MQWHPEKIWRDKLTVLKNILSLTGYNLQEIFYSSIKILSPEESFRKNNIAVIISRSFLNPDLPLDFFQITIIRKIQ